MVHILFLILKIIGIVLLVLLTLAFLILLFPISYRAKADLNEKSYNATVKAFWLFGIVHFGFVINSYFGDVNTIMFQNTCKKVF